MTQSARRSHSQLKLVIVALALGVNALALGIQSAPAQQPDREPRATPPAPSSSGAFANLTEEDIRQAGELVAKWKAMVSITVRDEPVGPIRTISGFVIDAEGFVATFDYDLDKAKEIRAAFADGNGELSAELVGRDPLTRVALLRVRPVQPLTPVNFGDSGLLRVGDTVLALGRPSPSSAQMSLGTVSELNRTLPQTGPIGHIQTTQAVTKRTLGGPLLTLAGEVVGLGSSVVEPKGLEPEVGFAVPSSQLSTVLKDLREQGRVRRGWLGVRIQGVTPQAMNALKLASTRGAVVVGLAPGGPAQAGGIEAGDIVLRFDGKEVSGTSDLVRAVTDTPPGKVVEAMVMHKGTEVIRSVTVGLLPERETPLPATRGGQTPRGVDQSGFNDVEVGGLKLAELTDELRQRFRVRKEAQGAVVLEVTDEAISQRGVSPGQIVVEVGGTRVRSTQDVASRLDALKGAGRQSTVLTLATQAGPLSLSIPLR